MAALLCEYTKNHWTVHFKMVSFMVYKLYLNKAVIHQLGLLNFTFKNNLLLIWIIITSLLQFQKPKVLKIDLIMVCIFFSCEKVAKTIFLVTWSPPSFSHQTSLCLPREQALFFFRWMLAQHSWPKCVSPALSPTSAEECDLAGWQGG